MVSHQLDANIEESFAFIIDRGEVEHFQRIGIGDLFARLPLDCTRLVVQQPRRQWHFTLKHQRASGIYEFHRETDG